MDGFSEVPKAPIRTTKRPALIRDVYRLALGIGAVGSGALGGWRPAWGWSFAAGAALALVGFWLLERALAWLLGAQRARRRAETLALVVGKYLLMGVGVYWAIRRAALHPLMFGAGLTTVYLATVLRLGATLCRRQQTTDGKGRLTP